MAQMMRFELMLQLSRTTPLAGEPLEPLGYICSTYVRRVKTTVFLNAKTIYHKNNNLSKHYLTLLKILETIFTVCLINGGKCVKIALIFICERLCARGGAEGGSL